MSGLVLIGAGPGLGRSITRRFAREGLSVTLIARSAEHEVIHSGQEPG
ncbi:MAG TPA: hypothetical protein VHZ97_14680 [Pseudonocardiaceae bacterium]|jgi:NAD(P)-dependent dehydrogenase (short-subunit alcohol dehydrogenase family)|nr:hypothetical protein [Pseudonocardiaceae bacterium]